MTARQMYDFFTGQVEWYSQQTQFCEDQIRWYTGQLKRSRQEDRDLASYALAHDADDPVTMRIFSGKFVSHETRKLINARNRYYRELKRNRERITHFQREADEMEHYIG